MTKTYYDSDLKSKTCGLCEYYTGAKRNKDGWGSKSIEVDVDGICTKNERETRAGHYGCSHFNLCGQAQAILSELQMKEEQKRLKKENEKAQAALLEKQRQMELEADRLRYERAKLEEENRIAAMTPSQRRSYYAKKQREEAEMVHKQKEEDKKYAEYCRKQIAKFKKKKIVCISFFVIGLILMIVGIVIMLNPEKLGSNLEAAVAILIMAVAGVVMSAISIIILYKTHSLIKQYKKYI
ncbi:MAG: hypothetical protein MJ206_02195 [Bacilli bacterium]|nr:hypothetical protein [Bacilli bacterium]